MTERVTILHTATHETELGDHDFCLGRSHYTDPLNIREKKCIHNLPEIRNFINITISQVFTTHPLPMQLSKTKMREGAGKKNKKNQAVFL